MKLSKQHIHRQPVLHQVQRIFIFGQSERGYHGQVDGFFGFGFGFEGADFISQIFGIRLVNSEFINGKFHFTKIDYLVVSVNTQVYLYLIRSLFSSSLPIIFFMLFQFYIALQRYKKYLFWLIINLFSAKTMKIILVLADYTFRSHTRKCGFFSSKRKIPAYAGSTAIFRAVPLHRNFLVKS